jgi:hypothetical protein
MRLIDGGFGFWGFVLEGYLLWILGDMGEVVDERITINSSDTCEVGSGWAAILILHLVLQ